MADKQQSVNPPQQARSRRTERAITDALAVLLREKPFADISVAEIASRADVSVGGFYARFASKDALLDMVELSILEEFSQAAAAALDPARFLEKEVSAITHAYAQLLVTHFRSHRSEIVQILKYTRPNSDTEDRLRQFNTAIHDRMRALLRERRAQIQGDDIERTINLGLFMTGAACREAVLTRNLQVYPVDISDEQLSYEIGAAFCRYLTADGTTTVSTEEQHIVLERQQ